MDALPLRLHMKTNHLLPPITLHLLRCGFRVGFAGRIRTLLRTFARVLAVLLATASAHSPLANAASVKTPHVEASLVAKHTSFVPGQPIEVALRLKIIDHWHTYWRNPGDSGLPTKLKWTLPEGFVASEIVWPHPKPLPMGPLMNYGYESEVLHLVTLSTPASFPTGREAEFSAQANWLVCADVCIPEEGVVSLKLKAAAASPQEDGRWKAAFAAASRAVPHRAESGVTSSIEGKQLHITARGSAFTRASGLRFYPFRDDLIANAEKQPVERFDDGFRLSVTLADPVVRDLAKLEGVLVASDQAFALPTRAVPALEIVAPVSYAAGGQTGGEPPKRNTSNSAPFQAKTPENAQGGLSLAAALMLALLGGVILNLMPCVFPVLGIKVMGFVNAAHGSDAVLRRQGLSYTAGIIVSFLALALLMLSLRGAGQAIGWGFQMQQPGFVVVLILLFFFMALNLSGVFEIGTSLQAKAGDLEQRAQTKPVSGAFFSGVLATAVATPCMAPGLGASVGYTLGQSTAVALAVFGAIALGLALPVLALSFFPALLRWLPKPGAWMQTFKEVMAFPLYATVVWLVWVLGSLTGNDAVARILAALVTGALAAWIYGRWQAKRPVLALSGGVIALGLALGIAWTSLDATLVDTRQGAGGSASSDWQPFSKERVAELRAEGKPVFVDFTATWCITCQVNKRVALNETSVVDLMAQRNIVRLKADWTRQDPLITAALAEFGRNGVPLNVLYPVQGEPIVLPEILTPALVRSAIEAMPQAK
jgi:thiol:disulfide interchange protein DsbD